MKIAQNTYDCYMWDSQRGFGFPLTQAHKCYGKLATGSGSKPVRKYDIGLGLFGDGVATRIRAGTHLLQQLYPMEVPSSRIQRTGSEAGYGRLNVHPILRSASICICDLLPLKLSNYPFLLSCNLDLPSINWSFLD